MSKKADIGSKRLISLSPDRWLQWITNLPNVQAVEILDSEFQWLSRESDVLLRGMSPEYGELLTLIPFVPILRGGSSEATVREAVRVLRTDNQLSELENLLAFFATFVLETEVVQQIMRWDMAVLMESPWYRQIVEESEKRGRQIGLREGFWSTIQMALKLRFGEAGLQLMPEIRQIEDINLLERLCDVVETVESPEAFRRIYRNS